MANQTIAKKEKSIEALLKELKEINKNLKKFLLIIPEESLKEYKDVSQIKKAFEKATKSFPPK